MNTTHIREHAQKHFADNYPQDAMFALFVRYLMDEKEMTAEQAEDQAAMWIEQEGGTPEEGYPDAEADKFFIWYYVNIMLAEVLVLIEQNTIRAWQEDLMDSADVVILEDFDTTDYDALNTRVEAGEIENITDAMKDITAYNNWFEIFKEITDIPQWMKTPHIKEF